MKLFVLKNGTLTQSWLTQSFITVAQKHSPNNASIILFTNEKALQRPVDHTENTQNDRLYADSSTKKKDVVTKRLRTQLTFSHWRRQLASYKWLTLHQFDTCRSRSQGYWGGLIVEWCFYSSSCLPASSSSFRRTVPRRTGRLRESTFPHNFAKCWAIFKIISKQTQR